MGVDFYEQLSLLAHRGRPSSMTHICPTPSRCYFFIDAISINVYVQHWGGFVNTFAESMCIFFLAASLTLMSLPGDYHLDICVYKFRSSHRKFYLLYNTLLLQALQNRSPLLAINHLSSGIHWCKSNHLSRCETCLWSDQRKAHLDTWKFRNIAQVIL